MEKATANDEAWPAISSSQRGKGDGLGVILTAAELHSSVEEGECLQETLRRWEQEALTRRWEEEALTHFKNRAWEDCVATCKKVLQVQKADTNFDICYEIGYSYMRLKEYEKAIAHFMAAHRIDGQRVCLRMAMKTLQMEMRTRPGRKRSRQEVAASSDQQEGSKRISPGAA